MYAVGTLGGPLGCFYFNELPQPSAEKAPKNTGLGCLAGLEVAHLGGSKTSTTGDSLKIGCERWVSATKAFLSCFFFALWCGNCGRQNIAKIGFQRLSLQSWATKVRVGHFRVSCLGNFGVKATSKRSGLVHFHFVGFFWMSHLMYRNAETSICLDTCRVKTQTVENPVFKVQDVSFILVGEKR